MATNNKGYDPNKDYSLAIEQAKASGASQSTINQLTQERENKIADKYGGNEPTMWGSNKTYSQLSGTSALSNAMSNVSNGASYTNPYGGTNYHQDAIYAAQGGDWDAVVDYLNQRENKTNYTGENYGKTSAEIYAELWDLYGQQEQPQTTYNGGSFNYGVSKPTYNSNYSAQIDALLNQILSRKDFEYNVENDDLYAQYQKQYNREGTRAMNDTLAAAASNAGGMNSYAVTAAQQANNYYASQLSDKIPELYQLAYEMYLQDIDNQVRDLGLLQSMDDTQYNRYRDTMSDWYNDRDFAYGVYRDDVADGQWQQSFDYSASQDAIDNQFRQDQFDWNVSIDKRDYDYTVGRDAVEDDRYDDQWEHQLEMDDLTKDQIEIENDILEEELKNKVSEGEFNRSTAMQQQYGSYDNYIKSGSSNKGDDDSGSESNSGYAGNEGIDATIIAKMQEVVGATPDGKWGNNSKAAAGGLSASEAYKAYKAGTLAPSADNYEVTNAHGDDWVHVQGYGRITYTELYNYVKNGKIKEKVDQTNETITYTKA